MECYQEPVGAACGLCECVSELLVCSSPPPFLLLTFLWRGGRGKAHSDGSLATCYEHYFGIGLVPG